MKTKECPRRGLVIKDNWGKWRKAVRINCAYCQIETVIRTWTNRPSIYCSSKCSYADRIKQVKVICSYCNEEFTKKPSSLQNSRSGLYFCTRQCKDLGQRLVSGIEEIWPDHYGTDNDYRSKVNLTKCSVCLNEDYWKLTVHHIDGNRENNVVSNLEVVCYSCHCNRHSKLVNGRRILDLKYLTPRKEVKQLDMGH